MIHSPPLIRVQNLGVSLQGQAILQDINFTIEPREIITVIGPNGAGKTTLIRAVLGLQRPDKGELLRRPGLRVGYMPQKLHIDPTLPLTVERFLTLTRQKTSQLDAVLELAGIRHLLQKPVQNVSGGELQRVLLARTLLQKPDLLVLDEPAQGVDVNGQVALYQLIRTIRDDFGCAVLMVSHDLHLVMAATDRVICLNHHICCSGLPEQVSNDPSYQALFGKAAAETLAIYHHHHDHQHGLSGDIVHDCSDPGHISHTPSFTSSHQSEAAHSLLRPQRTAASSDQGSSPIQITLEKAP